MREGIRHELLREAGLKAVRPFENEPNFWIVLPIEPQPPVQAVKTEGVEASSQVRPERNGQVKNLVTV